MSQIANIYLMSFLVGLALVASTLVVSWDVIRSSMRGKNLRPLFFGIGIMFITFSFLMIDLSRVFIYPVWLYSIVGIGFIMLSASLVIDKWDYLIFLTVLLPLLIPAQSFWFLFVTLPILWVAHLAYKHFCIIYCTTSHKFDEKEGKFVSSTWAAIISLFALIISTYLIASLNPSAGLLALDIVANSIFKLLAVGLMGLLAFKLVKLTKRELLIFPIVLGFIIISASAVFYTSYLINNFVNNEYLGDVHDAAHLFYFIAEQKYPNGELAKQIEAKSPQLNDLADKIYLETDIRGVFFLGNERVAAAPSIINNSRNIGTRITDTNVVNNVLNKGQKYSGRIQKVNQMVMASYIPVYDGDRVIGMVAVGKTLDTYNQLQNEIINAMIAGGVVIMIIIIGAIFVESKGNLKTGNNK